MYGPEISAGAGTALAVTGLSVGGWLLLGIGAVFILAGVFMLLKKNSVHRP